MIDLTIEELRIGNYIGRYSSEHSQRIDAIKPHCIWMTCNRSDCDLSTDDLKLGMDELYAIPITEQWLIDFGFKDRHADKYTWRIDGFLCQGKSETYSTFLLQVFIKDIKYVHDLQNLYFALTGEELTLKDKL